MVWIRRVKSKGKCRLLFLPSLALFISLSFSWKLWFQIIIPNNISIYINFSCFYSYLTFFSCSINPISLIVSVHSIYLPVLFSLPNFYLFIPFSFFSFLPIATSHSSTLFFHIPDVDRVFFIQLIFVSEKTLFVLLSIFIYIIIHVFFPAFLFQNTC